MLRRDLVELCAGARDAGLYSSLITAGTLFTRERAQALKSAGLDHVQISIQSPDAGGERPHRGQPVVREEDRRRAPRAGARLPADDQLRPASPEPRSHRGAARARAATSARSGSSSRTRSTTAGRSPTRQALMPSWEQLRRAEEAVRRFRERVGPKVDVLWVLPDFYEELPKPCMGGWGRTAMVIAPNGDVHALPGRVDDSRARVRQRPRPSAGVDLERVRRVRALPRHGLDAGAMPERARSGARRWTGAAAAARRCGSRATRRPRIRSAASRPTTTASSRRASRRRRTSSSTAR